MRDDPSVSLNPWIWMWLRPAETMRRILETGSTRAAFAVASIVGIQNALWVAEEAALGDHGTIPAIVLLGCGVGAVSGMVSLFLTAALLTWLGRWFGGEGNGRRLRAAVAWSAVPVVWTVPLWLPKAVILGDRLFRSQAAGSPGHPLLDLVYGLETAARLWPIVLLVICVAEAHRLSLRRALATVAVAFLILLLAAVVVQSIAGTPGLADVSAIAGARLPATLLSCRLTRRIRATRDNSLMERAASAARRTCPTRGRRTSSSAMRGYTRKREAAAYDGSGGPGRRGNAS